MAAENSSSGSRGIYSRLNTDEVREFASRTSSIALAYGRTTYHNLVQYAEEGSWSWKTGGFFAGALIALLFSFSFLSNLFGFALLRAVLDLYLIAFGVIACCLEFKEKVFTQKVLDFLKRDAQFLFKPYGRAGFYFFVGLLVVSQGGFVGFLIGLYTIIIGVVIYKSSQDASDALEAAKEQKDSFDDTEIAAKFKEVDKDGNGCLDVTELAVLSQTLGAGLSLNELESALLVIDTNSDGKIEYADFLEWWKGKHVDYGV